jgi:phospholipase/carboxylesterase
LGSDITSSDKLQSKLGFIHRFIWPSVNAGNIRRLKSTRTLLLLHGTGGNEDDLVSLGHAIDPSAALLSPRGKVLEGGMMPRFFRRLAEGVFDLEDLKFRTRELADFVVASSKEYNFDSRNVVAVGYSNGANIASSMLLLRPEVLIGGILFRAMLPLVPEKIPDLSKKGILMSEGVRDPIATEQQAERLFRLFKQAGATNINLVWQNSGHELTETDVKTAKQWLENSF